MSNKGSVAIALRSLAAIRSADENLGLALTNDVGGPEARFVHEAAE